MVQNVATPEVPKQFFIDGRWLDPISNRRLKVVSPVTEELLMSYPEAGQDDIDLAVAAAREAFDSGPGRGWLPRSAQAICAGWPNS